ncbi:hypothetical protein RF55_20865 [Lasius niger]|uniref:Gag-pol polyprotein n=1 Tax=Lasius niger TaxID=67767 RepID=A0A0J7MRI8_LASNI|nr:hypothetical protein RF55_20865 [Lasius niger]
MDRTALEDLTLEQLREEAASYGLPTTGVSTTLVDSILSHLERNGPVKELLQQPKKKRTPAGPAEPLGIPATVPEPQESTDLMRQMLLALQQQLNQLFQVIAEQRGEPAVAPPQHQQLDQLIHIDDEQRREPAAAPVQHRQEAILPPGPSRAPRSTPSVEVDRRTTESGTPGGTVKALASQIPEFAGLDDDNVHAWVRRVDKVAQVHSVADGSILLAASSRLTKSARRWYDVQGDAAVESWSDLRTEMIKIFDRKVPFFRVMQKIEARKWIPAKETFDEYTIDKLALMHRVDLSEQDKVHLLVSGITVTPLKATALSIAKNSLDGFLERMRRITQGATEWDRKSSQQSSSSKANKDVPCRNCGKKGHAHKDCRGEPTCFYCKEKGHRRFDCPMLKKRGENSKQGGAYLGDRCSQRNGRLDCIRSRSGHPGCA